MSTAPVLRPCPSCGTRNRVPPRHLGVRPAEELVALLAGAAAGGAR